MDVAVIACTHGAIVLQTSTGNREPAIARHGGVERAAGRGAARHGAHDVEHSAAGVDQLAMICGQPGEHRSGRLQLRARPHDPVADRAQHQPRGAGVALGYPDVFGKRRWTPRPIGDHVAQCQRRHTVDQGLVRLGVEGDAVFSRPSTRYISHRGRDLSSGRAANRAINSCSCSSLPGDGSADRRTW